MEANGRVSHVGQFIDLTPGTFPSFDFVRALKEHLEKDNGTVFRYSSHESSVLNRIVFLLQQSDESDRDELIRFIQTLTKKKDSNKKMIISGMNPLMGGCNSLEYVLPVIRAESKFLREKYSKPVYGKSDIRSLNFTGHVWIKEMGLVVDVILIKSCLYYFPRRAYRKLIL